MVKIGWVQAENSQDAWEKARRKFPKYVVQKVLKHQFNPNPDNKTRRYFVYGKRR